MIAYLEANFILELALQQEEASSAEALLRLGEESKIELSLPAFALAEPFSTLDFRRIQRRTLCQAFRQPLEQLERSSAHEQLVAALHGSLGEFERIAEREREGLQVTATRLLRVARLIELDAPTFEQAIEYEGRHGLDPKDAIIYAAVVADLRTRPSSEPKCFVSRDKDFFHPAIEAELEDYGCRYVGSFDDGLQYVESCLD